MPTPGEKKLAVAKRQRDAKKKHVAQQGNTTQISMIQRTNASRADETQKQEELLQKAKDAAAQFQEAVTNAENSQIHETFPLNPKKKQVESGRLPPLLGKTVFKLENLKNSTVRNDNNLKVGGKSIKKRRKSMKKRRKSRKHR